MKKILIFSLCGLFSLDDASGMPIGELLNPENTSVSEPSSPALPDIEEFPIVCDIDKEGIVKSIRGGGVSNIWQKLEVVLLCFDTSARQSQKKIHTRIV